MTTLHDNGRTGDPPDLDELIDHAGAVVAAVAALSALADHAGNDLDGFDSRTSFALFSVAGDAREAHWYLKRALHELRELI